MHRRIWIAVVGFILIGGSSHTFGAFDVSLFPEMFNTDSPSISSMNGTDYTNYLTRAVSSSMTYVPGTANVAGGQLNFDNGFFETDTLSFITKDLNSSTSEKFTLSVDLEGIGGEGNYLVGLVAGNRALGFWAGWSNNSQNHALYAYNAATGLLGSGLSDGGPGSGGAITGDNHLEISWDPGTTTWTYKFTKVNGGGASHTQTFLDPTFVMGEVGVFASAFGGDNSANFDNLNFIPEPSLATLLGLSAVLLQRRRG